MRSVFTTALSLLSVMGVEAVPQPAFMVLSAPWTPYNADGSINPSVIGDLAKNAAESGVNTIWVAGSMGQFDALTMDERNSLLKEWVTEGHRHNIFVIAHVGTTVQSEAIEMAHYAVSVGADAIAAVPPYYETGGVSDLVTWLEPVLGAAPQLPFFYYHIPGLTKWNIQVHDLATQAKAKLPNFKGVKYVESNQDDFFNCVTDPALNEMAFMWAPEPKLQSFAFPGKGTVLAEPFYAGTFLRMWSAFNDKNDMGATRKEMMWKNAAEQAFNDAAAACQATSTTAKRAVMKALAGVDMGPSRSPQSSVPLTEKCYQQLLADLTKLNFFNQTIPAWAPPRS